MPSYYSFFSGNHYGKLQASDATCGKRKLLRFMCGCCNNLDIIQALETMSLIGYFLLCFLTSLFHCLVPCKEESLYCKLCLLRVFLIQCKYCVLCIHGIAHNLFVTWSTFGEMKCEGSPKHKIHLWKNYCKHSLHRSVLCSLCRNSGSKFQ